MDLDKIMWHIESNDYDKNISPILIMRNMYGPVDLICKKTCEAELFDLSECEDEIAAAKLLAKQIRTRSCNAISFYQVNEKKIRAAIFKLENFN